MAAIILPHRMRQQPQNTPVLDYGNPLMNGVTEVAIPTQGLTLVRGTTLAPTGSPSILGGRAGMGFKFSGATAAQYYLFGTREAVFPSLTDCTVFIYKRHTDTTLRQGRSFGYIIASTDCVATHAPYSDGNIYWDFGNQTATSGGGRVSASYGGKTTDPVAIVLVAGGAKGREIWKNGTKLVGNTALTASRQSGTSGISTPVIGNLLASAATADAEEIYLVGVVARAWSDAEIRQWSQNPWGIFKQYERMWIPGPASPPVTARPQVFIAT